MDLHAQRNGCRAIVVRHGQASRYSRAVLHTQPEGKLRGCNAHREGTLAAQRCLAARADAAGKADKHLTIREQADEVNSAHTRPLRPLRRWWERSLAAEGASDGCEVETN